MNKKKKKKAELWAYKVSKSKMTQTEICQKTSHQVHLKDSIELQPNISCISKNKTEMILKKSHTFQCISNIIKKRLSNMENYHINTYYFTAINSENSYGWTMRNLYVPAYGQDFCNTMAQWLDLDNLLHK